MNIRLECSNQIWQFFTSQLQTLGSLDKRIVIAVSVAIAGLTSIFAFALYISKNNKKLNVTPIVAPKVLATNPHIAETIPYKHRWGRDKEYFIDFQYVNRILYIYSKKSKEDRIYKVSVPTWNNQCKIEHYDPNSNKVNLLIDDGGVTRHISINLQNNNITHLQPNEVIETAYQLPMYNGLKPKMALKDHFLYFHMISADTLNISLTDLNGKLEREYNIKNMPHWNHNCSIHYNWQSKELRISLVRGKNFDDYEIYALKNINEGDVPLNSFDHFIAKSENEIDSQDSTWIYDRNADAINFFDTNGTYVTIPAPKELKRDAKTIPQHILAIQNRLIFAKKSQSNVIDRIVCCQIKQDVLDGRIPPTQDAWSEIWNIPVDPLSFENMTLDFDKDKFIISEGNFKLKTFDLNGKKVK